VTERTVDAGGVLGSSSSAPSRSGLIEPTTTLASGEMASVDHFSGSSQVQWPTSPSAPTRAEMLTGAVGCVEFAGRSFGHLTCCVGICDSFAQTPRVRRTSGAVTFTISESAFQVTGGGALYGSRSGGARRDRALGNRACAERTGQRISPRRDDGHSARRAPARAYVAARVVSRLAINTDGERRCAKAPSP
jgi:hypothetical protein